MLILRIFGALLVITLGVSLLAFVVTRDHRWLRFLGQTFKLGAIILLIFFALYAIERLAIAI